MTTKSDNSEEMESSTSEVVLKELVTPTGFFTDNEGVECLEYSFVLTGASKVSLFVSYNEDPIGIVGDS